MSFGPYLLKSVLVQGDSLVLELADPGGNVKYRPRRKLHFDGTAAVRRKAESLIGSMVTTETYDPLVNHPTHWWQAVNAYTEPTAPSPCRATNSISPACAERISE